MNLKTKKKAGLRKNLTVRKIMTNNRNPSMSIDINSALFNGHSVLNLKRAPKMSLFVEGLSLFGSFTLDPAIRVNELFLDVDVTKLSGTWDMLFLAGIFIPAKIKIKRVRINSRNNLSVFFLF